MTDHPAAREVVGYWLVSGGLHIVAYARALEVATGVDVSKLVPIPSLSNKAFNESRKYEEKSLHTKLYTNSDGDFAAIKQIWKVFTWRTPSRLKTLKVPPQGSLSSRRRRFLKKSHPASLNRISKQLQPDCSKRPAFIKGWQSDDCSLQSKSRATGP